MTAPGAAEPGRAVDALAREVHARLADLAGVWGKVTGVRVTVRLAGPGGPVRAVVVEPELRYEQNRLAADREAKS